ncbi:MAG: hypothetical protein BWX63_01537 [Bacteroidetes bacterium ADurb.Bin041]|nr:MAG: hypothetical protein BWX63_01537 [Bacteroidetes bacterium ADurb.Bin041]
MIANYFFSICLGKENVFISISPNVVFDDA